MSTSPYFPDLARQIAVDSGAPDDLPIEEQMRWAAFCFLRELAEGSGTLLSGAALDAEVEAMRDLGESWVDGP